MLRRLFPVPRRLTINKHQRTETVDQSSRELARLIAFHAPNEGYTLSALESVRFMRSNRPLKMTAVLYDPSIVIVCQGRKRGFLGNETFVYDARNYLVLSVPLPFFTETEASADEPLLALALSLDMAMIADLMLMLERGGGVVPAAPRSMVSTPVDGNVAATTLRLLQALADPLETRVLAPSILREIYFHVLLGPQGGAIRTALAHRGGFGRISNALQRIQRDFAQSLTVAELACEVHLSVPAFHAQFKAVTHTSPLQYIKATRLHQARILMLRDSNTAAAAAAKVGYLSASQFGREFKRFFGRSPAEEARCMRAPLSLAPARELTRFDLVH